MPVFPAVVSDGDCFLEAAVAMALFAIVSLALVSIARSAPYDGKLPEATAVADVNQPVFLPRATTPYVSTTGGSPDPTSSSWPESTSDGYLYVHNTSLYWGSWTQYLYGPTTGLSAEAVTCNAKWIEFRERSSQLRYNVGPTAFFTSFRTATDWSGACQTATSLENWFDAHSGPVTRLCDDADRALGPREMATSIGAGVGPCSYFLTTHTDVRLDWSTPAVPACTLKNDLQQCSQFWRDYESTRVIWSATRTNEYDPRQPYMPYCSQPPATPVNSCESCAFTATEATAYYWPKPRKDFCTGQSGLTATPTTPSAGFSTVIVNGMTFTSPSVYLSFKTISAAGTAQFTPFPSRLQCGAVHTNVVMELRPEEVSTVRGYAPQARAMKGTHYPFDFSDFDTYTVGNYTMSLIPRDAYVGGSQCPATAAGGCSLIRDDYAPWLAYPTRVTSLDKAWSTCDLSWDLVTVVPVPLGGGAAKATLSPMTSKSLMGSASPQSNRVPPTPAPTKF